MRTTTTMMATGGKGREVGVDGGTGFGRGGRSFFFFFRLGMGDLALMGESLWIYL